MLKAVIFDMDGVIIDSEPMHARAAVLALQKYNVTVPIEYAYRFVGSTAYHMCQKMIEDFKLNGTPEELLTANNKIVDECLQAEGYTVIPHVIDLIRNLHQNGVRLIIASSSPSEAIEKVMDTLKIREYFNGYVSGMMVAHPKPAPDIFLAAAERLGVKPSECIVIEDSYNGVTSAAAAGMVSIGFVNPSSGKQDLSKAAMLVEGFDEVDYALVNRIYQYARIEPVTILTTGRCILRELSCEDAAALCDICNKPEISVFLDDFSGDPFVEGEKLKSYIKNIYRYYGFGLWGVFLKKSERLIGRCGIELRMLNGEKIHELGYLLDTEYQGRGYAREFVGATIAYCFNTLKIRRITAIIDKNNTRSVHLAEQVGMRRVGECIRNRRNCCRYEITKECRP